MTGAGGEFRAAIGGGRLAALFAIGLQPRTGFLIGALRAREQRIPIDAGIRWRQPSTLGGDRRGIQPGCGDLSRAGAEPGGGRARRRASTWACAAASCCAWARATRGSRRSSAFTPPIFPGRMTWRCCRRASSGARRRCASAPPPGSQHRSERPAVSRRASRPARPARPTGRGWACARRCRRPAWRRCRVSLMSLAAPAVLRIVERPVRHQPWLRALHPVEHVLLDVGGRAHARPDANLVHEAGVKLGRAVDGAQPDRVGRPLVAGRRRGRDHHAVDVQDVRGPVERVRDVVPLARGGRGRRRDQRAARIGAPGGDRAAAEADLNAAVEVEAQDDEVLRRRRGDVVDPERDRLRCAGRGKASVAGGGVVVDAVEAERVAGDVPVDQRRNVEDRGVERAVAGVRCASRRRRNPRQPATRAATGRGRDA